MKILRFSSALLLLVILSTCYGDPSCGDWEPFADQHCYKVIDSEQLHSHSDAERLCQQQNGGGASLISIRTKEEQDFLTSYLFTRLKVVDDVWLGAQFVPAEKKYKWTATKDAAELTYSNWVEGSVRDNLADYCVQMLAAKSAGKWEDEPCSKKNLVVCQRDQAWTVEMLQKAFKELQQTTRTQLVEMQQKLVKTESELQETRQEMATKLQGISPSPGSSTSLPVGFIYVQLPGEKSPTELWSSLVWSDVSSTYAGVFFRVEGGNSTAFGKGVQEGNAPHLTEVDYEHRSADVYTAETVNNYRSASISESGSLKPGQKSTGVRSGFLAVGQSGYNMELLSFTLSGGEVRPRNLAVKIWKRTG